MEYEIIDEPQGDYERDLAHRDGGLREGGLLLHPKDAAAPQNEPVREHQLA